MSALALALILSAAHAVDVAVARVDLAPGVPIQARDVVLEPTSTDLVVAGPTFKRLADAVGRVPIEWIYAGEIVRGERLAAAGATGPEALLRDGETLARVTIDVPVAWAPIGAAADVLVHQGDFACRAAEAARILGVTAAGGRATGATLALRAGSQPVDGATVTLALRAPSDNFVGSSPLTCETGPPAPPEQPIAVGRSLLIPLGPDATTIQPERFGICDAEIHEGGYLHVIGLAKGVGRVAIETPWGDDVRVFHVVAPEEWEKLRVAGTRERWELSAGGARRIAETTTWTRVADPTVATLLDLDGGRTLLVGTTPGATDVVLATESATLLYDVVVTRPKRDGTYGPDISQVGGKLRFPLPDTAELVHVVDPGVVTTKLKKGGTELEVRGATEGYTQVFVFFARGEPFVKELIVGRPSTVEWTRPQ